MGFIAVRSRLSDLPFTAEDKRLLANVGAPTSFAVENARLIEQRNEAARRREELKAENEAVAAISKKRANCNSRCCPNKSPNCRISKSLLT
jgi:K+-sensing histidine kinase KdpD